MLTTSSDPPTNRPQVMKNNNKDYKLSKLLTKEVSMSNFSKDQDSYHGGVPVSIPFTWESQPGTPKMRFRENPLPPLTPPPSYFYDSPKKTSIKISNPSKSNLLGTILPKRVTRKTQLPTSSASSSSSSNSSASFSWSLSSPWSSSYSVQSSAVRPSANFPRRCEISSPRLSFDSRTMGEQDDYESHVSTFCFPRATNSRLKSGCYSSISKVLLRDS